MRSFAVLILSALAHAQSFEFQPSPGDRFELRVYKTGLLSGKQHVILFERFRGSANETKAEFVVEANSLVVKDDWAPASGKLDEIRAVALNEMLDAKNHPELRFVSTAVTKTEKGYRIPGELTIRGKSKPVTVEVERKDGGIFEGRAQIKHSDYGLKRQSAALGAIGTKDEMDVIFRLTGVPRP
jgi:polyisoprenoid-binding protein YceI